MSASHDFKVGDWVQWTRDYCAVYLGTDWKNDHLVYILNHPVGHNVPENLASFVEAKRLPRLSGVFAYMDGTLKASPARALATADTDFIDTVKEGVFAEYFAGFAKCPDNTLWVKGEIVKAVPKIGPNTFLFVSENWYFLDKDMRCDGEPTHTEETNGVVIYHNGMFGRVAVSASATSPKLSTIKTLNRVTGFSLAQYSGMGTLKGKRVVLDDIGVSVPFDTFIDTRKSGTPVLHRTKNAQKKEVPFEDGNEVKATKADFSQFCLINDYLFKVEGDSYIRVKPSNLHTHIPVGYCDDCSVWFDRDDLHLVGKSMLCAEHAEQYKHKCCLCETSFYDMTPPTINNKADKKTCHDCFMDKVYECSHHSHPVFHAITDTCDSPTQIKNYSWNPSKLRRLGKSEQFPFHLGIELEIHAAKPTEVASFIRKMYPGVLYFKSDSSIVGGGIEIVSVPLSFERARDINLERIKEEFGSFVGAEGHGGMHVHVDRTAFTSPQVRNIAEFMYKNSSLVHAIADRESNYGKIQNPESFFRGTADPVSYTGGDRYSALSFCKGPTLEYRLFNSTLTYSRLQKNLDFVVALWELGKIENTKKTKKEFEEFVGTNEKLFPFLHQYLTTVLKKEGV